MCSSRPYSSIVWGKQQEALFSMSMQPKQNIYTLFEIKETSPHEKRVPKLEDKFTYLSNSESSTKINTRLAKAWSALDGFSFILKLDLSDKIQGNFFPKQGHFRLLYGCTLRRLTKRIEIKKQLDGNRTIML